MRADSERIPAHLLERHRHRTLNTLHTWLLASGSLLLLAVTAFIFAGVAGVVLALVFGGLTISMVRKAGPKMVLSMYKAEAVAPHHFPEGHRLLAELARRAGLPVAPKLYVVPSRTLNAFAVGGRDDSAIAVTDGLIRALSLREFAGVMAHEVSHIAHGDLKVMAFADMVARYTSFMSTVGIFTLFFNVLFAAGGYAVQVPWLAVLILVFSPTIGGLLQLALSRTREFDADLGAALLTGDPDGLASALVKLETAQRRTWEAMMLPGARIPDPSLLRTHPPTRERVARLMAIKERRDDLPSLVAARQPVRARTAVPTVPRRFGSRADADISRLASFIEADGVAPLEIGDALRPSRPEGLSEPDGRPRIRIRRGGVWW